MYQKDTLREYVQNSELRIFSNRIKVRLSRDLAIRYDKGAYTDFLSKLDEVFALIDTLHIIYPGNAKPFFYVYIVPDDNYAELLQFPSVYDKGKGGGKPVRCYDLDGFNSALGLSQNMFECSTENMSIARVENDIHELAHIVHSMFFHGNQTICEGFAEALPLYALGLENEFDEHREALLALSEDQILTAQELLNSEKDGTFGTESVLPNRTCSFRLSYISSYLFVRGCMETIARKENLTPAQAVMRFLEIVRHSNCSNEWLIYDIAEEIGIDKDELLDGKRIQMEVLKSIELEARNVDKKLYKKREEHENKK